MWIKTYQKHFKNVGKEKIWHLWQDINNWPKWHDDLEYCKLEGLFKVGNHFTLKPKGVRPVKITLTEIEEGKSFTDCTHFFGAKMYDTHTMEETKEGLLLSNKLVVTGPLKGLWIKLVAENVANTVAHEVEALVALARETND